MTGITQAKQLSSRMLAQSSRLFSFADLRAKKDMRTSVLVLCISTNMVAAPALSDTRVSLSLHNSSTVVLSFSRYAFLRRRVFRACSRFRSRLALAFSSGERCERSTSVLFSVDSDMSSVESKTLLIIFDPAVICLDSQSVSLADTKGALLAARLLEVVALEAGGVFFADAARERFGAEAWFCAVAGPVVTFDT